MLAIIGLTSVSAILVPTYAVPTIKSGDIFDGEVKTADLANGAVTNPKLANDAVTSGKIKNGEVTTDDIKDKTIQAGYSDGVIPDGGGAVQWTCIEWWVNMLRSYRAVLTQLMLTVQLEKFLLVEALRPSWRI